MVLYCPESRSAFIKFCGSGSANNQSGSTSLSITGFIQDYFPKEKGNFFLQNNINFYIFFFVFLSYTPLYRRSFPLRRHR